MMSTQKNYTVIKTEQKGDDNFDLEGYGVKRAQ